MSRLGIILHIFDICGCPFILRFYKLFFFNYLFGYGWTIFYYILACIVLGLNIILIIILLVDWPSAICAPMMFAMDL